MRPVQIYIKNKKLIVGYTKELIRELNMMTSCFKQNKKEFKMCSEDACSINKLVLKKGLRSKVLIHCKTRDCSFYHVSNLFL